LCNVHGRDLAREVAGALRGHGFLLAGKRHAVLRLAFDLELGSDVFRRLGHGIGAIELLHARVHEAPAYGRVVDRSIAAEGGFGLGHDEGRAAHALDAAGDHQARLARLDRTCRRAHGVQPRAAQAIDGRARHFHGQAGEQARHVRDVAVVLARLVRTAVEHVGEARPIDLRIALHQRLDRDRGKVVGAHARERAAIAADRGADGVADEGLGHGVSLSIR